MTIRPTRATSAGTMVVSAILLAGASVAAAPQATSAPKAGQETMLDLIFLGGYVMIPLGICSLLAVTFFLERIIALRENKIIPDGFTGKLRELTTAKPPNLEKAFEFCVESKAPIGNAIKVAVEKWRRGRAKEDVEKSLEDAAAHEVSKMTRSLRIFRIIAAISPLLGLLGTVYGLIRAFQTVAADQKAIGKAAALAHGIYEAMVTTAAGLTIAIPTLVIYYYFQRKVDLLADEMETACDEFMDAYQEAHQ